MQLIFKYRVSSLRWWKSLYANFHYLDLKALYSNTCCSIPRYFPSLDFVCFSEKILSQIEKFIVVSTLNFELDGKPFDFWKTKMNHVRIIPLNYAKVKGNTLIPESLPNRTK